MVFVCLLDKLLVLLNIDYISCLEWDNVKEVLTIVLYHLHLFNQLVDVDAVLLDSRAMGIHYLLTNIPFRVLWHVLTLYHWATVSIWTWVISHVVVATRHVLHFHIIGNWLLPIDLTYEWLHAFRQALWYLCWHVRNDIDNLLLPLLSFVISLYHIKNIVVLHLLLRHVVLHVVELSLNLRMVAIGRKLFKQLSIFVKDIIALVWINWIPVLINVFVFLHTLANSFRKICPLLLILLISLLQGFIVLLHHVLLLTDLSQVFPQLFALLLLLMDVMVELFNSFLQIIYLCIQRLFFIFEFFFDLKYLNVNHFIFLNLSFQLFLCESKVLINFFKFFFDLIDLLATVSWEKTTTEVGSWLRLVHRLCLAFVFQFLQNANAFCQPLIV